jgi:ABC-type sugar transport system substrate-binding protein
MKRNRIVIGLLILGLTLLGACAAPAQPPTQTPVVQTVVARETVVSVQTVVVKPTQPTIISDSDALSKAIDLASKAASGKAAEFQGTSGKTIGIVMPQFNNDGFLAMYIGVLTEAIKQNASITTLDAQLSVEKQLSMIEDLISKKVDAIVFVPVDSDALSTGVKKANDANIPIVAMDRSTTSGTVTALVESDNVAHGAKAADLMLAALQAHGITPENSKILELLGDQATSAGVERHQGFIDRAKALKLNIVTALPTYWDNAKANAAVMDAFQSHPEINAIYSASGCAMYAGIESALKSLNKLYPGSDSKHIVVVDVDGCPISLDGIRNGYLDADASQQILVMGMTAAQSAIAAAAGKAPASATVLLPPIAITKENVDDPNLWANVITVAKSK